MSAGIESRCWGCRQPLPRDRLGPGGHSLYHDRSCDELHLRELAAFAERHPELPGWGRSEVAKPGEDDVLEAARTHDGRPGVRFVRGPTRKDVKEHFGRDTLPVSYYLDGGETATIAEARVFLQESYPKAEILGQTGEDGRSPGAAGSGR